VISCGLPAITGRKECDQPWLTGDTGEELMCSTVGYRQNKGDMNVINCGLPKIQGRNECDQLWLTGDTREE
jgi:hypothetical protein